MAKRPSLSFLIQLISPGDLKNVVIGIAVVAGGLALAGLTLYAHEANKSRLAGIAAGLSLLFILLILIFVIPPLAKKASREASQMNLPFEITLGGSVMIVLVLVVGFSAWNTGNNLLFIVLSVMLAAMTVGFVAGWITLRRLEIRMRFPETIYAEEAFPIALEVRNAKRVFPAMSVVAEVRGKERETIADTEDLRSMLPGFVAKRLLAAPFTTITLDHLAHIAAGTNLKREITHKFDSRGRFRITDFELSTGFPFGFFRHRRRLAAKEANIIIFPDRSLTSASVESASIAGIAESSRIRGAGDDLLFLRDYETADDTRSIDWKATARTRRLTVREFASDKESRVRIVVGGFYMESQFLTPRERLAGKTAEDPHFEEAIRFATRLVEDLHARGSEFSLSIGDEETPLSSQASHFYRALTLLALARPSKFIEPSWFSKRMPDSGPLDTIIVLTSKKAADEGAFPTGPEFRIISF